ncbi:MAG: aspartate aminotransferase family protein, partial [Bacteroidales bacterium]
MLQRELFLRHLAQTSSFPLSLEIKEAEGLYMYDSDGKRYLDLISGISVSALGHRHPKVVQAVKEQAERYLHLMVYGEFVQSPQVELAKMLVENLPPGLDNVFFVNSGSESVEGALKLAKRYTGRTEIVSFYDAYHGSSHGSLSVGGNEKLKNAFRPLLPDVRHLCFGATEQLSQISERTACVIAETIQGEAGAVVPNKAFMKALRKRCDETGALLILDEIQAGMGRSGALWAFSHYGIVPDILTLAKALGGGMPLGAFIAGREVMRCLTENPVLGHINTFGGNAVCAAAAKACLTEILEERLWLNAAQLEHVFRKMLVHPDIIGVRGKGLLLAVEFENFGRAKGVIDRCIQKGVLTDWFLFADNCLRIAPPLTITEMEV